MTSSAFEEFLECEMIYSIELDQTQLIIGESLLRRLYKMGDSTRTCQTR